MLFGTFHLTSIMLLATVSALNEEVPSETEVPVNGFVMGGPKSTVGEFAGKLAVAEKASNRADSVETFEDKSFDDALKNPYEILFGRKETDSIFASCVKSNVTTISNSTALNSTLCLN